MHPSTGPWIVRLSCGAGAPAHHPLVGFSSLSAFSMFPMVLLALVGHRMPPAWVGVVGFEGTVETPCYLCT